MIISLKLALLLFLSSLPPMTVLAETKKNTVKAVTPCKNGECIEGIIDRLKGLGGIYREQCLPKNIKSSEIKNYHSKNGVSEECWKYITEINHLENELQQHQTRLEARLGCEGGNCNSVGEDLTSKLIQLKKVEENLSCNEVKKQEVKNKCGDDMSCVLASTALSAGIFVGGYIAEAFLPKHTKMKDCHLGDDSCLSRLALGFLRATTSFLEGAWDLLKLAGKKAGEKMSDFWKWVKGPENHSSTSQLALAKASEDPGVFDMLIKDFPGTMSKVWNAFIAAIKEWFKANIFCQKWSGRPHRSQCLQPTDSFDCLPCKNMVTGICAMSGALVAEIVPAFLTGGLLTAAKHGVNGATKISKLFSVSTKTMDGLKSSRVGKAALQASSKIDETLKITQGLRTAKVAVEASIQAIKKYLLSPARNGLKASFSAMSSLVRTGRIFIAQTKTGKILVFPGTVLKTAFNIIIYPIDNPMTTFAFNAGARTFDKIFKYGPPRLANKTVTSSTILSIDPSLEPLLVKIENAKSGGNAADELLDLEEELVNQISRHRKEATQKLLPREDVELSEIIDDLYPELRYGDLSKRLLPQQVARAEKELYLEISYLPASATKERLKRAFRLHVEQGEARSRILREPFKFNDGRGKQIGDIPLKTPARQLSKTEIDESREAISFYMGREFETLVQKSKTLEASLKKGKNNVYDVIAVGSGPHTGLAVSAARETGPNLKVLIIEPGENLSALAKSKSSTNTSDFPGSSVQISDLNIGNNQHANGVELDHLTLAMYQQSDVDLLLKNKVIGWKKEPARGVWPAKYKVELENGSVIYSESGIIATGQSDNQTTTASLFSNMAAKSEDIKLIPVFGEVGEYSRYTHFKGKRTISERFQINGSSEDIYTVKQSSESQIVVSDLEARASGPIDFQASRSAATGKLLVQNLYLHNPGKKKTWRLLTSVPGKKLHVFKMKVKPDIKDRPNLIHTASANIDLKIQLSKLLRRFKLKPNAEFKLRIQQHPEGGHYVYEVHGLDRSSSHDLIHELYSNDAFHHSINAQFKLQRTDLNIRVRARETGHVKMEDLTVHGQLTSLESPFLTPVDMTESIRRGGAPLVRSGNAVNAEIEKDHQDK